MILKVGVIWIHEVLIFFASTMAKLVPHLIYSSAYSANLSNFMFQT